MMAVDTIGTYQAHVSRWGSSRSNPRSASPTVSLSRSKIFILVDDAVPDAEGSPAVTILEMYPETAATTSIMKVEQRRRARRQSRAVEEVRE